MSFLPLILTLLLPQRPLGDATNIRRQIEAQYDARARAAVRHDVRGVLDTLAPGFQVQFIGARVADRKQWEDQLRAQMSAMAQQARQAAEAKGEWKNPAQVRTVIQKVTTIGGKALVSAVTTTVNTARYPEVSYRATLEETTVDTWVRTAVGWRLQKIEHARNRTTTDEAQLTPPKAK